MLSESEILDLGFIQTDNSEVVYYSKWYPLGTYGMLEITVNTDVNTDPETIMLESSDNEHTPGSYQTLIDGMAYSLEKLKEVMDVCETLKKLAE